MTDYLPFYSSVQAVREDSGVDESDLGYSDETNGSTAKEQLDLKIMEWLTEAKGFIDQDRKRDFSADLVAGTITKIPPCIENIAKRIAVNMAKQAKVNRQSPILKVDDYTVKMTDDTILTKSILSDLKRCSPRPWAGAFGIMRCNTQDDDTGM